jgi:cytochrome P450
VWIKEVEERHKKGLFETEDGRKTMLDLLLQPQEDYPPLSEEILVDETFAFCFAGTHTTSLSLSLGTYYLLNSPAKLRKLLEELSTVKKNSNGLLEYRDVCNLPYLVSGGILASSDGVHFSTNRLLCRPLLLRRPSVSPLLCLGLFHE